MLFLANLNHESKTPNQSSELNNTPTREQVFIITPLDRKPTILLVPKLHTSSKLLKSDYNFGGL